MENFQPLLKDAEEVGFAPPKVTTAVITPNITKWDYVEFNERIGLPFSRLTDQRAPMTQYQIDYSAAINKFHRIIVNKTKKGGFTDGFLRHVAHQIFHRYAGHEVVLVAGNKEPIARDIMERLYVLFEQGLTDDDGVHWSQEQIITNFTKHPLLMQFFNGTKIIGSTASKSGKASPVRGYSDVVAWFITEAAFTGVNNDYPILNGLTSLTANRDEGDMILESTPNGRSGFFYDLSMDATENMKHKFEVGPNGFYYLEYDYTHAVDAGVISKAFIEEEKKNPRIDFQQEYCCAFTSSSNAAFDPLSEENFQQEAVEDLSKLL